MKIIKTSTVLELPVSRWWIGREAKCLNCEGVMELEESDAHRITQVEAQHSRSGKEEIIFICPTRGCCHTLHVVMS